MCPSPCVWNEGNYNHPCSTAGSHEPCGQAYDSASCETTSNPDCRWQAGADANDENGCGSCYNATRYGADAPCDAFFTKPHACCPTRYHWTVVVEAPDESNDMPDYGEEGMDGALPRPKRSPASSTRTRPLMERMTSLGKITRQG